MKQISRHPLLKAVAADLTIFAFFCALLCWLGAYNFTYIEHLSTFYYQGHKVVTEIKVPGGLSKVIADFLIQFFVSPAAGVAITAALLAFVTILMGRLLRYLSDTLAYTPLAFLPAISLAMLHYHVNYMYSGTVALALMLLAVNVMFRRNYRLLFTNMSYRVVYTVVVTFLLYTAAGAAALLFGLIVIISSLFKRPREAVFYLVCPVLTFAQAQISVRSGLVCDLSHAMLPEAYFTHRLDAHILIISPWAFTLAVSLLACVLGRMHLGQRAKHACFAAFCAVGIAVAAAGAAIYAHSENETFKQLNCLVRQRQWDEVITLCPPSQTSNPLLLNCVNLALAERGELADSLPSEGRSDLRAVIPPDDSNPYLNMLLSDIYWSMGHIALAQRYAFAANLSLGNASPRMLQRLVDTNMVFGQYKVADKYLRMLQRTLYYKDWANRRRAQLSDEAVAADPELSAKRACIPADDLFAGALPLADELRRVAAANPAHTPTGQYIEALSGF